MLQILHQVQNLGYSLGTTCFDNKLLQYCSPQKPCPWLYISIQRPQAGGGGYCRSQVTGILSIFWVWNFRFRNFFLVGKFGKYFWKIWKLRNLAWDFWGLISNPGFYVGSPEDVLGFNFFSHLIILVTRNPVYPLRSKTYFSDSYTQNGSITEQQETSWKT